MPARPKRGAGAAAKRLVAGPASAIICRPNRAVRNAAADS